MHIRALMLIRAVVVSVSPGFCRDFRHKKVRERGRQRRHPKNHALCHTLLAGCRLPPSNRPWQGGKQPPTRPGQQVPLPESQRWRRCPPRASTNVPTRRRLVSPYVSCAPLGSTPPWVSRRPPCRSCRCSAHCEPCSFGVRRPQPGSTHTVSADCTPARGADSPSTNAPSNPRRDHPPP